MATAQLDAEPGGRRRRPAPTRSTSTSAASPNARRSAPTARASWTTNTTTTAIFTAKLVSNASWNRQALVEPQDDRSAPTTSTSRAITRAPAAARCLRAAQTVGAGAVKSASDGQQTRDQDARRLRAGAGVDPRPNVPHRRGALRSEQRVRHELPARVLSEGEPLVDPLRRGVLPEVELRQPVPSALGVRPVWRAAWVDRRRFGRSRRPPSRSRTSTRRASSRARSAIRTSSPRRSGEFEGGFETRVFGNRANIDFTYYNKKTKDALISLPDRAVGVAVGARAFARISASCRTRGSRRRSTPRSSITRRFGWDVTIAASHNSNKVLSLGVDPAGNPNKTIGTGSTRDSVGFPVNGLFLRPYHFTDANGDGIVQTGEAHRRYRRRVPRLFVPARPPFHSERHRSVLAQAPRHGDASTTRAASTCCNNTWQFFCQQAPQACQENRDRVDAAVASGPRGGAICTARR